MPPLLAAAPAIAAISSLASAGAGVAGAVAQGQNPGTQGLDPNTGQMNSQAFGYGGGILSPEQQAFAGEFNGAKAANDEATATLSGIHQAIAAGQEALKKHPAFRTDAENAAVAGMGQAMQQLPSATERAQKAGVAFKAADAKMKSAPDLATSEANRVGGLAEAARNEKAPQMDLTQVNQTRSQAQEGRGNELQALGLARDAAMGNAPSAAQATLQKGVDAANQGAASMAASARGGGGNLALAGLQAGQQQAQNIAGAGQNAAILRADEMAKAREAFMSGSVQQRANELQAQGLDQKSAMDQATLESQSRDRALRGSTEFEKQKAGILTEQGRGKQAFEAGDSARKVNLATGNRTAANEGFQNTQHAISTAFTAGGQALTGLQGALRDKKAEAREEFELNKIRTTGQG
jgi:hypothetical protein